jgi:hydroxyacylglutathione hydrolase
MMQVAPAFTSGGVKDAAILPLPALADNYIWIVFNDAAAVVVDPGEAGPVLTLLERRQLKLAAILLTHHHSDHVGGVLELCHHTGAMVYGPARETLPRCDIALAEGDPVHVPQLGLEMRTLDVPGHTAGHIAYYGRVPGQQPLLFCGDTLFACGCGRLFEGTAAQMLDSLQKLSTLPSNTNVCCAHEYTLANLRWALTVDPANRFLQQWYQEAQHLREQGLPTLPSSIRHERVLNPFLRTRQVKVIHAATTWAGHPLSTSVEVFAALREWKNTFK